VDTGNGGVLATRAGSLAKGFAEAGGVGNGVLVSSGLSDGVGESTDGPTSVTRAPGLASTAKKSLVEAPR